MTIKIQDNGYAAGGIQHMISIFNTVAGKLFPECEVEHFYYGDKLLILTDESWMVFSRNHLTASQGDLRKPERG